MRARCRVCAIEKASGQNKVMRLQDNFSSFFKFVPYKRVIFMFLCMKKGFDCGRMVARFWQNGGAKLAEE